MLAIDAVVNDQPRPQFPTVGLAVRGLHQTLAHSPRPVDLLLHSGYLLLFGRDFLLPVKEFHRAETFWPDTDLKPLP